MPTLLVVGGGLFGAQAAAWARRRGIAALVFDAGREGAASPAAAGLFKEAWAGKKSQEHFHRALPLLERLYGIQSVQLRHDDGDMESFLFVSPSLILEPNPIRDPVASVGDGWLETSSGRRYEGWVYIAAGVWCPSLVQDLRVTGKAGAAFSFSGERDGRMVPIERGRQAIAFVRDAGATYFSDGTAEADYTAEHDRHTLARAAAMGLADVPQRRIWGQRPYTPGGPLFRRLSERTWLATGGRKMGTILGASLARRLVEEELPG